MTVMVGWSSAMSADFNPHEREARDVHGLSIQAR